MRFSPSNEFKFTRRHIEAKVFLKMRVYNMLKISFMNIIKTM